MVHASGRDSRSAAVVVGEWVERIPAALPTEDVARLFGAALEAIWSCATVALGDVSLGAITNRVLRGARVRFPRLRLLDIAPTPDAFGALGAAKLEEVDRQELVAAARFVLSEILALLGILTAELLTPALQEALYSVGEPAGPPQASSEKRETP